MVGRGLRWCDSARSVRAIFVKALAVGCASAVVVVVAGGCASNDSPSVAERVAEKVIDADSVTEFLSSRMQQDGAAVDPGEVVRSWLTSDTPSDAVNRALSEIGDSAAESIEVGTQWAGVIAAAVGPVDNRCRAEVTPSSSRFSEAQVASTVASELGEWLWPRVGSDVPSEQIVRAVRQATRSGSAAVDDTGAILGQDVSVWWCLVRWVRSDPVAEDVAVDSAIKSFNSRQRRLISGMMRISQFPDGNPLMADGVVRQIIELGRLQALFGVSEVLRQLPASVRLSPPVDSDVENWTVASNWNSNGRTASIASITVLRELMSESFGPGGNPENIYNWTTQLEGVGDLPKGLTEFLMYDYEPAYMVAVKSVYQDIEKRSATM